MRRASFFVWAALFAAGLLSSLQAAPHRALVLVSIDGLCPDYLERPDRYGLKIPNLRRLMKEGTHAAGVSGVLPTITYPSHTTLMTGVTPAKHGIDSNRFFLRGAKETGWYAYAEDIKAPTLWGAAAKSGYVVGSVSWPVTVGAHDIAVNIPEYAPTRSDEDLKIVRALTNGLLDELAPGAGAYVTDVNQAIPRDWSRTRYAIEMIRKKRVRFLTLHLAALDHEQHSHGPFSSPAVAALEELDKMIGSLHEALLAADDRGALCIVSDHGFAQVDHLLNLEAAFAKAGLISKKEWNAMPWSTGASVPIVMKDRNDDAARNQVKRLLDELAADPANGIASVLDRGAIARMGGSSMVEFWVDMRPGYAVGAVPGGALVASVSARGSHGYAPTHPEMNSVFLVAGRGIPNSKLDVIDMRAIAPSLAKLLGIPFTTSDVPAMDLASRASSRLQ